jgi:hypothetical protein
MEGSLTMQLSQSWEPDDAHSVLSSQDAFVHNDPFSEGAQAAHEELLHIIPLSHGFELELQGLPSKVLDGMTDTNTSQYSSITTSDCRVANHNFDADQTVQVIRPRISEC